MEQITPDIHEVLNTPVVVFVAPWVLKPLYGALSGNVKGSVLLATCRF